MGFTRDQLGRQSISEKRHASKDAKNTDTYQRTKRAREEREQQRRVAEAELRREEAVGRRRPSGQYGVTDGDGPSEGEILMTALVRVATCAIPLYVPNM